MASTAGKWAIGCGIGCLVIIVVLVAAGYGSFLLVKKGVEEAKEIGESIEAVHQRFGMVRDYTPDPSGAVAPERMQVFLAARDHMAEARVSMEQTLATLSQGEEVEGKDPGGAFEMVKAGATLLPKIMGFVTAQAEALLATEMGPGEYVYIYVMSYYSWLGKSPGDGPPFQLTGDNVRYDGSPSEEVRDRRLERTSRGVNRTLRVMLQNQLAAARAATAEKDPWIERLEGEIAAMEADPYRLPWADGLPEALAASLEPYRERLEASYSPLCNPLEIELGLK